MRASNLPLGWTEEDRQRFLAEQHRTVREWLARNQREFEAVHPRDPRGRFVRKSRRPRAVA